MEKEDRNNLRTKILEYTNYSVSSLIPAEAIKLSYGWTIFDSKSYAATSHFDKSAHSASVKEGFNELFVQGNTGSKFSRDELNSNFSSDRVTFSF
ncbi:hypothetical protein [Chryseobacterium sp. MP_3.2]|uniref:hypothetical protein n=1 Tax=Chryseobacterium sp. MP_3.2 TaxID=3071712 RepID=UPI002DFBC164|nr:hypothetical protein [Chryseobacterium sp. MP_3.2]